MPVRAALRIRPEFLIAKTCIECHRFLERQRFGWTSGGRLHSACKDCMNARNRAAMTPERRRRNSERRRAKQRASIPAAANRLRRWREDEIQILADPALTQMEKARLLGRTLSSIANATWFLNRGELVAYETPHGVDRYHLHACRCEICREAIAALARAHHNKRQGETQDSATRSGQPWTGAELEVLATRIGSGMTLREFALRYGRTWRATARMREKVLSDPKFMKLAGVDDA